MMPNVNGLIIQIKGILSLFSVNYGVLITNNLAYPKVYHDMMPNNKNQCHPSAIKDYLPTNI